MSPSGYERLSALDASFLLLEQPNAYMHVACTLVFDAGPLETSRGGIDADAIKRMTAASLHQIPRYRQRLAYVPFENHPVWVDDDRFNLDYHLRHTGLPRPGSEDQLKRLSARVMQQHLDRRRPLWEIWVVEGLQGNRFALISKVHHCMIDGIAGVDLLKILLSPSPTADCPEPPAYLPRPVPSGPALLARELWRRTWLPFELARDLRKFALTAKDARQDLLVRLRATAETLGATLRRPSATPLNHEIGPHRRFDWLTMELAEIKEIRKAAGGSVNDVVLAVVAGAVRRFLERRHSNPAELDVRVLAPVSVRGDEDEGTPGNRVSAWLIDLPVGERDPLARLRQVAARTAQLKRSQRAVGAEILTQVAEWTPSTLLALGARNATKLLPFNMVVTNVPGPQFPMYMLGARLRETFPHVPLADHLGLGIALLSYDGRLGWGFNADYELVPDLGEFVAGVRRAFDELRRAALGADVRSRPPRPARGHRAPASPAGPARPKEG